MNMIYVTGRKIIAFHKICLKSIIAMCFLLVGSLISGCSETEQVHGDEYLVRVEESVLMALDFQREFETTRSACLRGDIKQDASICREAKKQLLNQMVEELIIIERAKELNITVSDSEFEESVRRIKQDYPENEFENMLLEYSVSYSMWEKRLRARLLVEKVIAEDLKKNIEITSYDISRYYRENIKNDSNSRLKNKHATEAVIKNLRNLKAQEAYKTWFEKLQKKYKVEINDKQWEKILS
jgi:hypothetical protein